MNRVVSLVLSVVAVSTTLAACATHIDVGPAAEGPPRPRPMAAPDPSAAPAEAASSGEAEPPPHLGLASLARDPASPSDPLASAHPSCPDKMVLIEGEYCTEVKEDCVEWEDPPSNKLAR